MKSEQLYGEITTTGGKYFIESQHFILTEHIHCKVKVLQIIPFHAMMRYQVTNKQGLTSSKERVGGENTGMSL